MCTAGRSRHEAGVVCLFQEAAVWTVVSKVIPQIGTICKTKVTMHEVFEDKVRVVFSVIFALLSLGKKNDDLSLVVL